MNVISSVATGIAIILFSLYFGFFGWRRWDRVNSILATLLIISIIQFIISIYVSSFACRATCSPGPYVNITVVANPEGGSMVNPFPAQHNGEVTKLAGTEFVNFTTYSFYNMYIFCMLQYPLSTVNTTTVNSLPTENPPPYSENKGSPDY
ncbi:hypothetical protein NFI96_032886 [Prochilodus magdalenae]|nr:hypothetical protein NFI96_032886 [Prochilodus magdalenae]